MLKLAHNFIYVRKVFILKERITRLIAILIETFSQWQQDNAARVAGSLAFFSILSLAPLLLITVSVLGLVTDQDTVKGEVYQRLSDVVGEQSADMVQNMVQSVNKSRSGGIAALIGVVTLIYGATGVFGQLQEALNAVWEVDVKPDQGIMRTFQRRLWAAVMLPLTSVVMLLALVIDTALSAVAHFLGDQIPHVGYVHLLQGMSFVVFTLVLTFLFAVIYKYLPDVNIEWEDVLTGAAVTALLFAVGQFLLSFYLTRSSVTSTYGAAGTFMAVLLWVYYSAQIFLFGAEFTQVFTQRRGKHIEPSSYAYRRAGFSERSQEAT